MLGISRIGALALLCLAAALAGCGKVGRPEADYCAHVARILFPPSRIATLESVAQEGEGHGVLTKLTLREEDGTLGAHHVRCVFAGGRVSADQLALKEVATDLEGPLSPAHRALLDYVLEHERQLALIALKEGNGAAALAVGSGPGVALLYFLQQLVNGATLGCITALLAVGYTLIYGIIGVINLAFGEIYMIGAVITAIVVWLFLFLGVGSDVLSLLLALPLVIAIAAGYGFASDRLVFRPLRRSSALMPLIASVGLSILLQNYVFLVGGARNYWLPVRPQDGIELAAAGGFSLYLNRQQFGILALTLLLVGAVWYLLARTSFGRSQRAASQDRRMAALLGVDTERVTAATFALGGGLAGAGGLMVASYYGGASFGMGLLMGLKALTAAIAGGIGNFKGALLGGFLVAYLETFWAGYLPGAYRSLSVFALLILILVFRPEGLLGEE